jgi:ATP-binding cassette subfamily F protein uup
MTIVTLINAELAYGLTPLLDAANCTLQDDERVGLIGRNGTGKSTLLKVIAGETQLDSGLVQRRDGLRIAVVEQEPLLPPAETILESLRIRGGFEDHLDDRHRWRAETRLIEFLTRLGVPDGINPERASGGELKRAALALALALEPDLLLLDEPTNHLDIAAIEQLEELLQKGPALLFVTHDRWFLDRVANRILELDRGMLKGYPGNFTAYELQKGAELAAEAVARRKFDRFWAQEEVWIRKGVEARRTRNEGRVRRLEALRQQRSERRERLGNLRLAIDSSERSGKLVAELEGVCKGFNGRDVVRDLDLRVMRGDRLGLVGANGAGKSTLLKLILGELEPDSGKLKLGTQLQVAYFDQLRTQLDPEKSVAETISPGSDWVEINGQRQHISGYMSDFLFSPQRAGTPVKALSGGERNRLLLARLFARPANLLVMDEPTNDLDMESLDLLEGALQNFPGTLLLVSHDRAFLDNVVTQVLVAQGDGRWQEYAGGYSDALAQGARPPKLVKAAATSKGEAAAAATAPPGATSSATVPVAAVPAAAAARDGRRKLSFKETRELAALPEQLAALEAEQAALAARMCEPDYHKGGAEQLRIDRARASEVERRIATSLARWEELEALA